MKGIETRYFHDRLEWRKWLESNFDKQADIWLEYPNKASGKKRITYNDAVEEALCFNWIDSTVKSLNDQTTIQRFCHRRSKSSFSQPNIERLRWLLKEGLVHPTIVNQLEVIANKEFVFPQDILDRLRSEETVWKNYNDLSASYRRIRIAYVESARKRPIEFEKRLDNFIAKTRANKLISGYGGIDKYY
ncbi:MAG: hypothetical protein HKN87_12975 [Saprospiraceae bacterium]|nr:hypothetical protein [Saprospiraceae bacterium]